MTTFAAWPQWYKQTDFETLIDASSEANFTELTGQSGWAVTKETDTTVTFNGADTTKVLLPSNANTRYFDIGVSSGLSLPLWAGGLIVAYRLSPEARTRAGVASEIWNFAGNSDNSNLYQKQWLALSCGYFLDSEWQYAFAMPGDWAVGAGSPTFAGTVRSKFRMWFPAGSDCHMWIGQYAIIPRTRPKIIITFDDGVDECYSSVWPEAKNRGIKTNFAIYSSVIDTTDYMTSANLTTMQADSYAEFVNHSLNGDQFTSDLAGDVPQMTENAVDQREWMLNRGLGNNISRSIFVYPGGQHNGALIDSLRNAGFLAARAAHRNNTTWAPIYGADNPRLMSIPLTIELSNVTTLAQAKTKLDSAIRDGTTCIVMGHKLGGAADSLTWVTSDYTDFLDYVAAKKALGLIDDMHWSDWYAGLTQPQAVA